MDSVRRLEIFHGAVSGLLTGSTARVLCRVGGREQHVEGGECTTPPIGRPYARAYQTKPNLQTIVTTVGEKTKFTKGNILSGHFWYTNFWVPDLFPPSLLILAWGLPPLHIKWSEDLGETRVTCKGVVVTCT